MNKVEPWGVYTAEFPYVESAGSKLRPVVVVSHAQSKHKLVVMLPVSSRIKAESVDVVLHHWKEAGLLKPSVVRVHRLTTLRQPKLDAKLGNLSLDDTKQIQAALQTLLLLT